MTPFVTFVTYIVSVGVVIVNIITLFLLFVLGTTKRSESNGLLDWVAKHVLLVLFIVSLSSSLGTFFYSHIAGFIPCELCWYQRIFLFSQVIMYGSALYLSQKKTLQVPKGIFKSGLILSCTAALVGIFQYYGSMFNPGILSACESVGVSCSKNYFITFGYINIPMMALSTFLLLSLILLIKIKRV